MDALSWFFSLLVLFLVIRTFIAVKRVRKALSLEYLDDSMQLAVLKENLLENALESNLDRLIAFCKEHDLSIDPTAYRPLMQIQRQLRRSKEPLVEDTHLFDQQAQWLDTVEPIEFQKARDAHAEGDFLLYTRYYLEGVLRYYSDEKVIEVLGVLENTAHFHSDFPIEAQKVRELAQIYHNLCHQRDTSLADPDSLTKLQQSKEHWMETVMAAIPEE